MPPDVVRLVKSPLISDELFIHGFPERGGGVSTDARASLNLGHRWGDSPEAVEENRRRLAHAAGFEPQWLVGTQHVHGVNVYRVGEPLPEPPEFDGVVTDRRATILGAFASDCLPLVFADPHARICGAAHAGWRGTVNRCAVNVVRRMQELGASAGAIRVAIGPSIGPCCFEVGDDVVDAFVAAFGDADGLVVNGPRKRHLDLRVATRVQLEQIGVLAEHIDDDPPCTQCTSERFFSYRRDGKAAGVHMGFIGLR